MVTTTYLQVLPNPLYIIPLTNAYYNTLINPAMVICFSYRKDGHFALSCLEPKNIGNIKEIEEEEVFNKLGKEEP